MDRAPSPAAGTAPTGSGDLAVHVEPGALMGARVDVDARRLTADRAAALRDVVYRHKLVVLPGQHLGDEEYIALARTLGEPQIYFQPNYHHPHHPEIFVSANVPLAGRKVGVAGTGRYWHTDYQFFPQPLPMTMLTPRRLPSVNRETFYIDMENVLARLPDELAAMVGGRRARHEARWRYKVQPSDVDKSITEILEEFGAITPPVLHPAVITHPVTGAKLLYVSRGFTVGLEGMTHEEGQAALAALFDFIERDEHVHRHRWEEGDVLLWDNRQLVHMASTVPPGEASVTYRIGIYDGLPFYSEAPEGTVLA